MIKRSMILLIFILFGAFGFINADDASPIWSAWLHDGNQRLILVDANGDTLDEIELPLTSDYIENSVQVTISPDSRFIAYTFTDEDSNNLRIYQLETETITYEMTISAEREISSLVFDSQSRRIAFGVSGSTQNLATLMLVNVVAGIVETTIDAGNALFPDTFNANSVTNFEPEYFEQNSLVFARLGSSTMTYQWYFDSETMIELPNYPLSNPRERFDLTGEQIAITSNNNTLTVYEPVSRSWSTFFTYSSTITSTSFVKNGERILINGENEANENLWLLIERNGSLVRPLRDINRLGIHGVADGFIYTYWNAERETTELIHYDSQQLLSDQTIWLEDGTWQIVWVNGGNTALSAFMPWAQIGEVLYDAPMPTLAVTMEPTGFPMPAPLIYIGREVEVNTIDGEVLYLRDEPVTGEIIMNLLDRMMLTVIDGPVEAEGYVWWQVVNEDGIEGWAAQAVDDVTTLLPR